MGSPADEIRPRRAKSRLAHNAIGMAQRAFSNEIASSERTILSILTCLVSRRLVLPSF